MQEKNNKCPLKVKYKTLIKGYFRKTPQTGMHIAAALGRAVLVNLLYGKTLPSWFG